MHKEFQYSSKQSNCICTYKCMFIYIYMYVYIHIKNSVGVPNLCTKGPLDWHKCTCVRTCFPMHAARYNFLCTRMIWEHPSYGVHHALRIQLQQELCRSNLVKCPKRNWVSNIVLDIQNVQNWRYKHAHAKFKSWPIA